MKKIEIINNWKKLSLQLKNKDIFLRPIIEKIGPPKLEIRSNYFRSLVEYIVWQQLSPQVANIIIEKIKLLSPPFPKPDFFIADNVLLLRNAGLSNSKITFLKDLSIKWKSERWRKGISKLSDMDLIRKLCEIKGIGIWTAQMFLIFSLGRPNVLPSLDYGIRKGIKTLYKLDLMPSADEVPKLVSHWESAYSVGSWYIWQALNRKLLI